MAKGMFQITKETVTRALLREHKKALKRGRLAVQRGLEVMRSFVIPFTPIKTGRLVGSIEGQALSEGDAVFGIRVEGNTVIGVMGTNVPYAKHLEFGTSRIKPRRFFQRGIDKSVETVKRVVQTTMKVA